MQKSKKNINLVDLSIKGEVDADDMGHRLVQCVDELTNEPNVVNLIKLKIGDCISREQLEKDVKHIQEYLRQMGARNCIFVPIVEGHIEDVTIERIEVSYDGMDNEPD